MSGIDPTEIAREISRFELPLLGWSYREAGVGIDVRLDGGTLVVTLQPGFPAGRCGAEITGALRSKLAGDGHDVDVRIEPRIMAHAAQTALSPLPAVRNVIAVASAKGGVGKSTTAVNIAAALAAEGGTVGILDADVYGPSQPTMLGLVGERPVSRDGKHFEPLEAFGLQAISMGFLVDTDRPFIWRGPMVTQALQQMIFQTNWRDLDYLVVDLPPGTGDIQLTLTQRVPLAGAIIVTTPQDIALMDARRGLRMFEKVDVPVLGIVENMSVYQCPKCGHEEAVFGSGGGEQLSADGDVPLLGRLPLNVQIREEADSGHPTVVAEPDGLIARRYREIALRAAARIAISKPDRSGGLPKVVVEN